MGARLFRAGAARGDRIEIIDYTTLLADGWLPKPVQAPACLDELVDWTSSANTIIMTQDVMQDTLEIEFRPHIKTSSIRDEHRERSFVNQKHVEDFPERSSFDLSVFYEANVSRDSRGLLLRRCVALRFSAHVLTSHLSTQVVIVAEPSSIAKSDVKQLKSVLSVSDFCTYYILLRRYSELMDLGRPPLLVNTSTSRRPECGICMDRGEDMVLPCLHGICSSCSDKWVSVHGVCPFCRHLYKDQKRMEKDQWQVSE